MTRTMLDAVGAVVTAIIITKAIEVYGNYKYRKGLEDARK